MLTFCLIIVLYYQYERPFELPALQELQAGGWYTSVREEGVHLHSVQRSWWSGPEASSAEWSCWKR